jgi:hypothetical protein
MIEKHMREYRRQSGDFELVDCADVSKIEQLRQRLAIDAPLTVNWQWEYGSEVAELRNLYEKGKRNQWNASTDVDWDSPLTPDEWVVRPDASLLAQACRWAGHDERTQRAAAFDEIAYALSQLLHGEQAALQICGQLTNLCPKTDEKWYAASQVADEARHIEAISKFLSRKMGAIYPINPSLKVLLDELLAADTARKKTLGMQTLFEGMAVGIMDALIAESANPLLTDILRKVQQDESRHAAFGVLTMRRVVRDVEPEEKDRMEDWAFGILEAFNANQQLDMLRVLAPKYGLDPVNVALLPRMAPNWSELNSEIFMHTVVPNLLRLGLITERTRPDWQRLGMLVGNRSGPLPIVAE